VLAGAPATYHVEVSPDAFASVTAVGSVTPGALIGGAFFAPTDLDARRLWVRVRVTGGGPDNPAIRALTARWRAGALATPRRRWEVTVRASDQVVTLSGARDDRDGTTLAADLAALVGGPPVAFQDLDGASATVIVAEVEETAVRGAAPRAGEGSARVALEEAV
jgi:hypothetical protein